VLDLVTRFGLANGLRAVSRGWVQEELSEVAGLDRTFISGLECG
jgi:hypothetical protein